jgi:hypothetical protein
LRKLSFMCVVRVTRVLPSQWPVANPLRVRSAYCEGCGLPSIQMSSGSLSCQAPMVNLTMLPRDQAVIFIPNGPVMR